MSIPFRQGLRPIHVLVAGVIAAAAATLVAYGGSWTDLHALPPPDGVAVPRWLILSSIIFVAAIAASTVGFAFSAISGAAILQFTASHVEAVQIMMIASIGIQTYSTARLRHRIRWERCVPFIVGGLATLPLGIVLVLTVPMRIHGSALGLLLCAYGLFMLLHRPLLRLHGRHRLADLLVGALGGLTGPLAALPGIWLTIWCNVRGWDRFAQRAVYQPYILIMQVVASCALFGLQPSSDPNPALLAYAIPGCAGAVVGLRIFHAASDEWFRKLVNAGLVVSGVALLFK